MKRLESCSLVISLMIFFFRLFEVVSELHHVNRRVKQRDIESSRKDEKLLEDYDHILG